jgi:hypothetical protein
MKCCTVILSAALSAAALTCCGPIPNPDIAGARDLRPPAILSVRTIGPAEVEILFDEDAAVLPDTVRIQPGLTLVDAGVKAARVLLEVGTQEPGCPYTLQAVAEDSSGNGLSFIADFYGFNPRIPGIVINELTPRGSAAHPDLVELRVLSDGDMGGVTLYQGTAGAFKDRLIFPAFPVSAGDFILVHFKPAGDPTELDETRDKGSSGGVDASDSAFDFWIRGGTGIGGNNGVLSLYRRPGGEILDGVLYSNGVTSPERQYGGFGTAQAQEWAEGLAADGGWKTAGPRVAPEDAVNPEESTATRSINRWSDSRDTDTSADWHVVPTRMATFGAINSDEVYPP